MDHSDACLQDTSHYHYDRQDEEGHKELVVYEDHIFQPNKKPKLTINGPLGSYYEAAALWSSVSCVYVYTHPLFEGNTVMNKNNSLSFYKQPTK